MKALTISQPYASLIAAGEKWVENRTWPTLYRGNLAIHAGKGTQYLSRSQLAEYPTGCIVAVASLAACVPRSTIYYNENLPANRKLIVPGTTRNWSEVGRHQHTEGPVCWILENVQIIRPRIAINGAQGLWDVPADVLQLIQRALELGPLPQHRVTDGTEPTGEHRS